MNIDIRDKAEANIRFIRGAMERAERSSSVSGLSGIAMGLVALGTSVVASAQADLASQLMVWIGTAIIAILLGSTGAWLKARTHQTTLLNDAGRRFLLCLLPALTVGCLLTQALWDTEQLALLPAIWMLLYGCGLTAAGTYAARPIMPMGIGFMLCGLITYLLDGQWSNWLLAAAFGGLHITFGYQVYRNHGG
jgi:hypothetical protein